MGAVPGTFSRRPGAPAFWSAAAVPRASQRRPIGAVARGVAGGTATPPMARCQATLNAMGAVPGTFSRRKESQAPSPRSVDASRGRKSTGGTMPCPGSYIKKSEHGYGYACLP